MRYEPYELDVKDSVADGTAFPVRHFSSKTVEVRGTFVATLQVQGRISPAAPWSDIGATISSATLVSIAPAIAELRIKTTDYTSGTPLATFAGFNERTN